MRKFYLQNSNGERIDLNNPAKYLFLIPTGLGLSYMVNQDDISNGFYKRTKIEYPAIQIMGDLQIGGSTPYEDYKALANWLNQGLDLTFVYAPYSEEYYIDVELENLSKGEIESGYVLTCPIIMLSRTPWYRPSAKIINIVPDAVEQSTWDLEWDVVWSNNNTAGETAVQCGGHLPSAIRATVEGPLYDPQIILLKNGVEEAKMVLDNTTIGSGHELTYSSLYTNCGVWVDGVSQIPALDLANENFFRIPPGSGYKLRITSENSVTITGTISIYDYFRSV